MTMKLSDETIEKMAQDHAAQLPRYLNEQKFLAKTDFEMGMKAARTYYEGSDIHADGKAADDSFCEILRGFKEAGVSAELNAKGSVHRSHLQGHWEGISAAYYAAYLKLNDWLAVKYGKNYTKSPDRSPDNNTPQASEDKGLADERTTEMKSLLREYEQWEADIISEDKLWWPNRAQDVLRGPLYDKMIELQEKRNKLLKG